MSRRLNQTLSIWLELHHEMQSASFQMDQIPLSRRDTFTWASAITLWGSILEDLGVKANASSAATFIREVASLDVGVVASTLKNADTLVLSLTTKNHPSVESFIHSLSDEQLRILGPVLEDLVFLELQLAPDIFARVHQFLAFLGHVSFRDVYYNVLDDFVETDEHIPDPPKEICENLNRILREWMSDFQVVDFPQHGPGATSDGGGGTKDSPLPGNHSNFAKYIRIVPDQLLRYVWRKYGHVEIERIIPPIPDQWQGRTCNRTSRFQAVPKTILKRRVICMEPSGMQYFQQAVKKSLYDYIGHHKYLRSRIDLPNQETNRHIAYESSITGEYCTLDLSKASDSVGWALAKSAFAGTPLLPWLFATRSTHCETPYGVISLKKFATMGSALTFPVESLLFAAVCQMCSSRGAVSHRWWVYGDDIIVHYSVCTQVMQVLEALGFTINRDKSYYDVGPGQFRESCGGEYLNGYNVAPLRISRWFKGPVAMTQSPDVISGLVALANHCYARGYRTCRQIVLRWLLALPKHLLPAWGDSPSAVNGPGLANASDLRYTRKAPIVRDRLRGSLQRREVRVGVGECGYDRFIDSIYQDIAFFHWQLCATKGETLGCAIGTPTALRLKSRWVNLDLFQVQDFDTSKITKRGRFNLLSLR